MPAMWKNQQALQRGCDLNMMHLLGSNDLYRAGKLYTTEVIETLDHDFTNLAEGVIIPYGTPFLVKN